ncbi:unnamed protein product [Enterobius vermicularis]|uniref:Lipase n=1 Tax=Enterobius vermicularis TaxID=51028 RepID=A0A0N4V509_ENTVE|nr:unnamed protein product [Enterobius vermicularis]
MPAIIEHYRYPSEVHEATTADGYILELHRIPHGVNETSGSGSRPVVFLQHGFVGSSAVWVTNTPPASAGFMLADAGFDVWMGNVRGNKYSRKHKTLSTDQAPYWRFTILDVWEERKMKPVFFSWDEFVKYDLPAMIDYALNVTGQRYLYYVGYSEGTLTMFAKLASDQKFHNKIRLFFALGPIGTLTHIKGLIEVAAKNFFVPLKFLAKVGTEFAPNNSFLRRASKAVCKLNILLPHCESFIYAMTGPQTQQFNQTRMPVYMTHLPSGTSTANLLHWAQMVNSGKIQMYDYGSDEANRRHYGTTEVPLYNLTLVNSPVILYWSAGDWLADKTDIQNGLLAKLQQRYLRESNELTNFNHFDFIWGSNAPKQIYQPIIEHIRNEENRLKLLSSDD